MTVQLNELLDETGTDSMVYRKSDGQILAAAPQQTMRDFQLSGLGGFQQALHRRPTSEIIAVKNQVYSVVSVPVEINDNLIGVMTAGVRIEDVAAGEIKSLTGSEVVFLAGDDVSVSTLRDPGIFPQLAILFRNSTAPGVEGGRIDQFITPQGEHYLSVAGWLSRERHRPAGYILLSSFQKALKEMESTQQTLWVLSLAGILSSCFFVAILIRKMIRPLQQLRESAEAVGHGDFSNRVDVRSNDEFSELAGAFSRMMENLTASRAQAEGALKSLQEAQVQLIQTEKLSAIGEFIAGVAHELNNPLTAVVGFSEMLQDSGINQHQQAFTKRIIDGAERCHRIVQSLLSFARQHPPERKWIGINKLIEAVIEILSYEFRTGNIQVITQFSSEIPVLLVDPHQMQQVFLNIMNNARQAIEEHQNNGSIRVTTELIPRSVQITFQDNGPGVAPENLARIFDPFFTTKPVGIGTGLGLSLSYGIIREHNGTITARSKPGEGATFVIELPLPGCPETVPAEKVPASKNAASTFEGDGKTVLVIDDEEVIIELLKEALSKQGYEVDAAREGDSALRQFQQNQYDLIVCDWKIPGLSGQQIFEQFCQLEPRAADRFVFMTGDSLNPRAQQFLWEHNRPCLLKPFSLQELQLAIQKILHRT